MVGHVEGSLEYMSGNKRSIDKEFKLNAVKYKEEHPEMTYAQAAQNLGVSISSLTRWIKEFKRSKNTNSSGEPDVFRGSGNYASEDKKEIALLKKENQDLKDALEVLKKAMRIVSSQ